jgi:hypothetical protein
MRWHLTLSQIRAKKLELARLDPRSGMPIKPPAGASGRAIAEVERRLGRPLPPSYRAFLELYDGWPNLYHGISLLGARPLARGTYVDVVRLVLDTELRGASAASLVPFGIDAQADAIFAWDLDDAQASGELGVVVYMGAIAERVDDFPALLDLVHDMLIGDLAEASAASPRAGRSAAVSFHAA